MSIKLKLRFSANNGPFASIVKFGTWSRFSHVDFILPDTYGILAGKYLGALPIHGVCIHNKKYPVEVYKCIEAPMQVIYAALGEIGKPYDYTGILGFGFRRNWQDPDSWFCSEFISSSLHRGGMKIFSEEAHRISPRDLFINPYMKDCD